MARSVLGPGAEGAEPQPRHRIAAHRDCGRVAGPDVKRGYGNRGRGKRRPEPDAVALRNRLVAGPSFMEERRSIAGTGGAYRRRRARVERSFAQLNHVAAGVDPLDVDADLAIAGDRDQAQAAGVAEVEAQPGGRAGKGRLAVRTEAQLDSRGLLVQVVGKDQAQDSPRGCPVELGAPDVHLLHRHAGEDT